MKTNLDLQAAFDAEKKAKLQAYDFIITNGLLNDFRAFIDNTKDYSGEDYRQHINEMLNKLLDRLCQS
jgi:hypothetical protein